MEHELQIYTVCRTHNFLFTFVQVQTGKDVIVAPRKSDLSISLSLSSQFLKNITNGPSSNGPDAKCNLRYSSES